MKNNSANISVDGEVEVGPYVEAERGRMRDTDRSSFSVDGEINPGETIEPEKENEQKVYSKGVVDPDKKQKNDKKRKDKKSPFIIYTEEDRRRLQETLEELKRTGRDIKRDFNLLINSRSFRRLGSLLAAALIVLSAFANKQENPESKHDKEGRATQYTYNIGTLGTKLVRIDVDKEKDTWSLKLPLTETIKEINNEIGINRLAKDADFRPYEENPIASRKDRMKKANDGLKEYVNNVGEKVESSSDSLYMTRGADIGDTSR